MQAIHQHRIYHGTGNYVAYLHVKFQNSASGNNNAIAVCEWSLHVECVPQNASVVRN